MAQERKHTAEDQTELKLEPVKEIEIQTKDLVASSKIFIYLIIGLLGYLIFILVPDIDEKGHMDGKGFKFCTGTIRTIQEIN